MRYWKPKPVPGNPTVGIAIASYLVDDPRRRDSLLCLLYSLKAQTYTNWKVVIVHDGPLRASTDDDDEVMGRYVSVLEEIDERVTADYTVERVGQFGHPHRRQAALNLGCDVVGFTNDDNYYAPSYLEKMLSLLAVGDADFAYCDMVHSHKHWKPLTTELRRGKIDLGCFIARADLVRATPWTDFSFAGDWTYIDALAAKARKVVKVPATLFIHN